MRNARALCAVLALGVVGLGCSSSRIGVGSSSSSGGSSATSGQGCGLRTCASSNADCGPIGDGCGGTIDCGTCKGTAFCGGGGASRCGGQACTPTTCAAAGANCGVIADGCGGTLDCSAAGGGCSGGSFCGGGGPNACGTGAYVDGGAATCIPRSCTEQGANCGPVANGCGGLTSSCGSCSNGQVCGGAGVASVCGAPVRSDGGAPCTNLCLRQVTCDAGTTTLTGIVYAPNGVDPLYGALVYVPNGTVRPFTPGVTCLTCDTQVTGEPLVSTSTGPDGTFVLTNVPAGASVPLVIQLGRWRRQIVVPSVNACGSSALPRAMTRLPRNQSEGDIPLTAMVTGQVDALECVLRKMGLDDAEFTNPDGGGRVHLFVAAGDGGGALLDAATPESTALIDSPQRLAAYDLVLLACEGYRHDKPTNQLSNMLGYANVGGRVYATHFSYTWLDTPTTWSDAASWAPDTGRGNQIVGDINTGFPKGQAFSSWLDNLTPPASTAPGSNQIDITEWRWDVNAVTAPTQAWITTSTQNTSSVQHLTFNTPYHAAPAQQCGRVLFSDFHVANATSQGQQFPGECQSGPFTAQEHVLEFMLFDLASCITPDKPTGCTPRSCGAGTCGPIADGCGGSVQCAGCPQGQTCGGGGTPSVCGAPVCQPRSCAQAGASCGRAGDGCGGVLDCGGCPQGQTCGGGGTPSVCGTPACTPTTCPAQHILCGTIADGCGRTLDCGLCPNGLACGVGGPNLCGGFR
jgi:hypothetical protein